MEKPLQKPLTFRVYGLPASAGSKRFLGYAKNGRPIIADTCKRNPEWRSDVRNAAMIAMQKVGYSMLPKGTAIGVDVIFYMPRPKSHYRANGELKPNAPVYHLSKPDSSKLFRSAEDALTQIVWHDDCLVADHRVRKLYETPSQSCGMIITIVTLS